MDISIQIGEGQSHAISSYRVTENSTPLNAGDNSGGVGSLSIDFGDYPGAPRLVLKEVVLRDNMHGKTSGFITRLNGDDFEATMEADSRLISLVEEVRAAPYVGTLGGAIEYYMSLADVYGDIDIDPTIAAKPVAYMGWSGILYDKLKELTIIHRMEISLVADRTVIRPVRTRLAEASHRAEFGWNIDTSGIVGEFVVVNYNLREVDDEIVYPVVKGDAQIITLDADAEEIVSLETAVSLTSITQPVITQLAEQYYSGPLSTYTVIDKNDVVVSPVDWLQMGGSLRAEIDPDDDTRIIVTARGGSNQNRAPYKIAFPNAGQFPPENDRSGEFGSLVIHGTGVGFNREEFVVQTGVPEHLTRGRSGPKIDSVFVADRGMMWQVAASAAVDLAGPKRTVSATVEYTNRQGETGLVTGATYDDFEDEFPTTTYTQWNTLKGTQTYEQFADDYLNRVVESFDNQAFGNAAGSRVRFGDAFFRIRTATITQDDISFDAEEDTTFAEFAEEWSGLETYADFATHWGDATYTEFGAAALWH